MCPLCLATIVTAATGIGSVGGVTALVAATLRRGARTKPPGAAGYPVAMIRTDHTRPNDEEDARASARPADGTEKKG